MYFFEGVKYLDFGAKVKYVRELRGLTQTNLSELCNLSVPFLSEIETGKKRPSTKALERIAASLGTNTWFFQDDKAVTFEEIIKMSDYEPPEDIVEFFSKEENLTYAVLAKELGEEKIDPEFLRDLLESIKKMKSK
jgi:transcriptional regulator with XRE-family HTH domain